MLCPLKRRPASTIGHDPPFREFRRNPPCLPLQRKGASLRRPGSFDFSFLQRRRRGRKIAQPVRAGNNSEERTSAVGATQTLCPLCPLHPPSAPRQICCVPPSRSIGCPRKSSSSHLPAEYSRSE